MRSHAQRELSADARERDFLAAHEAKLVARLQAVSVLLDSPVESGSARTGAATGIAELHAITEAPLTNRVLVVVERVLRDAGKPLHYRELAERISHEVPLRGRDAAATLLAYISKSKRLQRTGRGIYTLGDTNAVSAQKQKKIKRRRRRGKAKAAKANRTPFITTSTPDTTPTPNANGAPGQANESSTVRG